MACFPIWQWEWSWTRSRSSGLSVLVDVSGRRVLGGRTFTSLWSRRYSVSPLWGHIMEMAMTHPRSFILVHGVPHEWLSDCYHGGVACCWLSTLLRQWFYSLIVCDCSGISVMTSLSVSPPLYTKVRPVLGSTLLTWTFVDGDGVASSIYCWVVAWVMMSGYFLTLLCLLLTIKGFQCFEV